GELPRRPTCPRSWLLLPAAAGGRRYPLSRWQARREIRGSPNGRRRKKQNRRRGGNAPSASQRVYEVGEDRQGGRVAHAQTRPLVAVVIPVQLAAGSGHGAPEVELLEYG